MLVLGRGCPRRLIHRPGIVHKLMQLSPLHLYVNVADSQGLQWTDASLRHWSQHLSEGEDSRRSMDKDGMSRWHTILTQLFILARVLGRPGSALSRPTSGSRRAHEAGRCTRCRWPDLAPAVKSSLLLLRSNQTVRVGQWGGSGAAVAVPIAEAEIMRAARFAVHWQILGHDVMATNNKTKELFSAST